MNAFYNMRVPKQSWLAVFLLLLAFRVVAQNAGNLPTNSSLQFRETVWDFGQIEETAGTVTHTFEFTNGGSKPVVIEHVSVSCGCTTPTYSQKPILPRQKGTISITYDPSNRPGSFSKETYVVSNSGTNRDVLQIRGTVSPRPRSIEDDYPREIGSGLRIGGLGTYGTDVNFSSVGQRTAKSLTVKYINTGEKSVALATAVEPAQPWFSVSAPKNICAGCRGEITLTYNLTKREVWGVLNNRVTLIVDGKPYSQPLQATGYGVDNFPSDMREPDQDIPIARLERQFFNFGLVERNKPLTFSQALSNEGGKTLIVRAVQPNPGVICSLQPGTRINPGKSFTFSITLNPADYPGERIFESVIVILNDPQRPVRDIRVSAELK